MLNFIKKQQYNYLLITGVIFFCMSFVISVLITSLDLDTGSSRLRNSHNFLNFVLLAVIIAPITEELVFRGLFGKYLLLRLLYFIGIPLIIFYVKNYYVLFLFIPHAILFFLKTFNKFKYPDYYDYFVNALLFGLMHFQLSDINIPNFFDVLIRFGSGLILVWIMLNFGIIKTIAAHIINNLILIVLAFFALQYPDQTQSAIRYKGYTMEWKQVPIMNKAEETFLSFDDHFLLGKRIGLGNLIQAYDSSILNDTLRIPFQNQMALYEIKILKADSTKIGLKGEIFRNLMLEAELLEVDKTKL